MKRFDDYDVYDLLDWAIILLVAVIIAAMVFL